MQRSRALDELDLERLGLLRETRHRAGSQQSSRVEHDDGVAHALHVAHQVRRDDDADPELAADATDQLEHLAAPDRVETGGRLVEEREQRIVDEGLRQLDALLHARGVRPHRPVPLLEQSDVPEHVGRPQARGGPREAADLRHVGEELGRRDSGRQAVVLGAVADPGPELRRHARVLAEDLRRARVRVDQAHEQLQRGRLPGAVRAEQARDALADLERDPVQRPHGAVRLRQVAGVQQGHAA